MSFFVLQNYTETFIKEKGIVVFLYAQHGPGTNLKSKMHSCHFYIFGTHEIILILSVLIFSQWDA